MEESLPFSRAQILRGGFFAASGHYAILGAGFLFSIILARILPVEAFGLFALANLLFLALDLNSRLGMGQALLYRQDTGGAALPTHLLLTMGLGGLSLLLAAGVAAALPRLGYNPWITWALLVLAALGLAQAISITPQVMLMKELRLARTTATQLGALVLSNLLAVALALRGWGPWSLVAGAGLNMTLGALGMWLLLPSSLRPRGLTFDAAVGRWFLRYGFALLPGGLAMIALQQLDKLLVGTLVSISVLGYYDRAYRLAQLPSIAIAHAIMRLTAPVYARLQDDPVRLARAFQAALQLNLLLSLSAGLTLLVAAPELVVLLFGQRWSPAAPLVQMLVVYALARPLQEEISTLLASTGQAGTLSRLLGAQALAMLLLTPPLVLGLAVPGVILGLSVTYLLGTGAAFLSLRGLIQLPPRRLLIFPLFAAAAGLAASLGIAAGLEWANWPLLARLAAKTGTALGVYGLLVMLAQGRELRAQWTIWNVRP